MLKIDVERADKPIMAVILDKETRASEVIDINALMVEGFIIDNRQKMFRIVIAFGGYDSVGGWHYAPKEIVGDPASVTIDGKLPQIAAIYTDLTTDSHGNPLNCFDDNFFRAVLKRDGVLA